jgi:hypothetical protein
MNDARLLALGDSKSPSLAILDAMKAGRDLHSAFREFDDFRQHFANAQLPVNSNASTPQDVTENYLGRLSDELRASFSKAAEPVIRLGAGRGSACLLGISFEGAPRMDAAPDVSNRFLASSIVCFDESAKTAYLVKPRSHHAWTIDQAVTDALLVTREIRGTSWQ